MMLDGLWLAARGKATVDFVNKTELGAMYKKRLEEYANKMKKEYKQYKEDLN